MIFIKKKKIIVQIEYSTFSVLTYFPSMDGYANKL